LRNKTDGSTHNRATDGKRNLVDTFLGAGGQSSGGRFWGKTCGFLAFFGIFLWGIAKIRQPSTKVNRHATNNRLASRKASPNYQKLLKLTATLSEG
jgi:hypothetical protein